MEETTVLRASLVFLKGTPVTPCLSLSCQKEKKPPRTLACPDPVGACLQDQSGAGRERREISSKEDLLPLVFSLCDLCPPSALALGRGRGVFCGNIWDRIFNRTYSAIPTNFTEQSEGKNQCWNGFRLLNPAHKRNPESGTSRHTFLGRDKQIIVG